MGNTINTSPMQERACVDMFGHTLRTFQSSAGDAVLMQVDDLYFVGMSDPHGDLVLSHHLLITNNLPAAEELCRIINETHAHVGDVAAYLRQRGGVGDVYGSWIAQKLARALQQCREPGSGRFRSHHCWHLMESGRLACCCCGALRDHGTLADETSGGR